MTYKDKELERQVVDNLYEMAAESLNPEEFDELEKTLVQLCERRHIKWSPT